MERRPGGSAKNRPAGRAQGGVTGASLPRRVLAHLLEHGPNFTSGIARQLDARTGAVGGALTSLRRRELVEVDHTEPSGAGGVPRIYYRAQVAPTGHGQVVGEQPAAPAGDDQDLADVLLAAPTRPLPSPDGDPLGEEVALLRAAHAHADLEALITSNRPVTGL